MADIRIGSGARQVVPRLVLIIPALVALLISLWSWQGLRAMDDLGYSQLAMSIRSGGDMPVMFRPQIHHDARLAMTLPLAATFVLFGVGEVALTLLPLVSTVLTAALLAWMAARMWGSAVGIVSGVLYATLPLTAGLSTFYIPEPMVGLELVGAAGLFLLALEREGARARILEAAAGVVVGLAYLTTEAGALMVPILYLYLLVSRRLAPRHGWLLLGFLVVLAGEATYHTIAHGNPMFRWTLGGDYPNDPMVAAANQNLGYRLVKAYPSLFIFPNLDLGVSGLLLLTGGLYGLVKWREGALLVIWAAVIFLFYNFMSVSFSHYVALAVTTRLVAPGCLALTVLAAKLIVDLWGWASRVASPRLRGTSRAVLAAAGAAYLAGTLLVVHFNRSPSLARAIASNARLAAGFLEAEPEVTVVSDRITARALQFYRGYRPADSFVLYEGADEAVARVAAGGGAAPVYVVWNGPVVFEGELSGGLYGRGFLDADRDSLPQPAAGEEVRSGCYPRSAVLRAMLRYPGVRFLFGGYAYALARALNAADSSRLEVRVYRYQPLPGQRGTG
jgi:hypothetical protein